jgi:hypothetical protein
MTTHGYSGTPLPKKLGIREGHRLAVLFDPGSLAELVAPLPTGVTVVADPAEPGSPLRGTDDAFDVVLCAVPETACLAPRFDHAQRLLAWTGGLWICWPKKSSSLWKDLDGGVVRSHGLAAGLVDNKVCAVDEDWSGLRFVHRREDRP